MKFEETKVEEWARIANWWAQFEAPWHPSQKRIEIYRRLLRKYSPGKKALVLGATPEIRDMLAEEKCDVTIVDQSPVMIKAMTSLRKTKSKETFVVANWMTYKSKEKFDAIFGDNVQNNISKRRWVAFEKNICNLLSKDGVFLNWEAGFYNPEMKRMDHDDIISLYRKNPSYFDKFENKANLHLKIWHIYKKPGGRVDTLYSERGLRKRLKKGLISQKEYEGIKQGLVWRGVLLSMEDTRRLLGRVFDIVEECIEDDTPLYNDFYRLFVLKVKK